MSVSGDAPWLRRPLRKNTVARNSKPHQARGALGIVIFFSLGNYSVEVGNL
jgi:hypothetical protein